MLSHTFTLTLQQKTHRYRDVAQLVSVRVWGACGRQFESGHPDKSKVKSLITSYLQFVEGSKVGEKSASNCLLIQIFSIGHFTQKFKKCLKKIFIPRINERQCQRTLHEKIVEVRRRSDTIGRTSIACIPDPLKKDWTEYRCKGYIEEIIQNLVCPKGISLDEPLTAEKSYYEKQCRYHVA